MDDGADDSDGESDGESDGDGEDESNALIQLGTPYNFATMTGDTVDRTISTTFKPIDYPSLFNLGQGELPPSLYSHIIYKDEEGNYRYSIVDFVLNSKETVIELDI